MIKNFIILLLCSLLCFKASAQFNYKFKDTTTTYVPLTSAASLNGSLIWDEENLVAPMPFTWKMDNSITVKDFYLPLSFAGVMNDTLNETDVNGFLFGDMDIADRGYLTNTSSLSPISYATVGTSPNRIFKVELSNAGFYNEFDLYNTMDDYFNIQIWIYETSNIVEFHYGPSNITYASDYFNLGSGPLVAYFKHVDADMGTTGDVYFLKGAPTAPTLDSTKVSAMPSGVLNSWPADGQVYRFSPKSNCTPPAAAFSATAPVGKTVQYTYTGSTILLDSLVWNFGDGQRKTVTTSFTTSLTHTFAADARYTVTVTAYSSCGSTTATKTLALAINGYSSLENVKVYPNPANDVLIIEGMEAGSKVNVQSIIGQKVMSFTIDRSKQPVNLSELKAGTYILTLTGIEGSTSTIRIVKQ